MPADISKFVGLLTRLRAASAGGARVKVGVLASAGSHPGSNISMVELAAIHEFGSPAAGIPERSFIRRTLELQRAEIIAMTRRISEAFLRERVTLQQGLGLLGLFLANAVRHTITSEQVVPRLAESAAGRRTIARKGSHVTLVDHAQLLNAISYEVVGVTGGEAPVESAAEGEED